MLKFHSQSQYILSLFLISFMSFIVCFFSSLFSFILLYLFTHNKLQSSTIYTTIYLNLIFQQITALPFEFHFFLF